MDEVADQLTAEVHVWHPNSNTSFESLSDITAGNEPAFRLVGKVAVKGRLEAVRVYELPGIRAECADAIAAAAPYEQALEAYFAREFDRAIALLCSRRDDPPNRVLLERCEAMVAHPPPPE